MLLDVKKEGDVVALKLTSGEEVIGVWKKQEGGFITLRKPLSMQMTQQGPGLAPYFATCDIMETPDIQFNDANVVSIGKVHKPFADAYMQATTGIDTSAQGSTLIT